ncbi:hypothetical protein AB0333_06485 [Citricoccus sp. NPDC079358]|uniref:hypothetical protein n=2 Tax=Micrococcales TaxID=85006 RepID=UPI00344C78E5
MMQLIPSYTESQRGDVPAIGGFLQALVDDDWRILREGEPIAVQRLGESRQTGIVDGAVESPNAFWVWLDDGKGRILLHREDKPRIWRRASDNLQRQ